MVGSQPVIITGAAELLPAGDDPELIGRFGRGIRQGQGPALPSLLRPAQTARQSGSIDLALRTGGRAIAIEPGRSALALLPSRRQSAGDRQTSVHSDSPVDGTIAKPTRSPIAGEIPHRVFRLYRGGEWPKKCHRRLLKTWNQPLCKHLANSRFGSNEDTPHKRLHLCGALK